MIEMFCRSLIDARRKRKQIFFLIFACPVILPPCCCSRETTTLTPDEYAVLIDAGSSGTRIWVYTWRRPTDTHTLPQFNDAFMMNASGGLAKLANQLQNLTETVDTLIKKVQLKIPPSLHQFTPIYIMATAGLRLLPDDQPSIVMEELDKMLKNKSMNPFLYNSHHNARILSGEEEGTFAWIAVNYLLGRFGNKQQSGQQQQMTSGILELGGASTQIAFIPRGSVLADKFPLYIAGEKYAVYVHSYLNYGQDSVDEWISDQLQRKNSTSPNDPCSLGLKGDPMTCLELLKELVYKSADHKCFPKPCSIGTVYQPKIPSNQTFYVVGAFLHVLHDLNVTVPASEGTFTPLQLYEAAVDFCTKDLDHHKKKMTRKPEKQKYIPLTCPIGLYMYLLFTRGYGFSNTTQQIIAVDTINGHVIDWTLGALIYENYNRDNECLEERSEKMLVSKSGSTSIHNVILFRSNNRRSPFFIVSILLTYLLSVCILSCNRFFLASL